MWFKEGNTFGSITAIRNDNKNVSLPAIVSDETLAELGYIKVVELDAPEYNSNTQYIVQGDVVVINGVPTKVWHVEDKSAEQIEAEYKSTVPASVTPRQARLALLDAGLLDEIEALGKEDREFQIWFEYSLTIERNHPKLDAVATTLGLTSEQIDGLFIAAGAKGDQ